MTRWTRDHDASSDRRFYYELGDDGYTLRHVELRGPERKPAAAAVKAEWDAALLAGTADDYYAAFGATPDMPAHVWEDTDSEDITAEEFERVWATARAACEARMTDAEPRAELTPLDSA